MQRVFDGPAAVHDYPHSCRVIEDSFTIQKAHLHPDAGPLLAAYADAFGKVWQHADLLAGYAARRRMSRRGSWPVGWPTGRPPSSPGDGPPAGWDRSVATVLDRIERPQVRKGYLPL